MPKCIFILWLTILSFQVTAETVINQNPESIPEHSLQNFNLNAEAVQNVIKLVLALARQNLTYQYGSANPKTGGMDCSGTIYYALTTMALKDVPRSAYFQYKWVLEKGRFYSVNSQSLDSVEFSHLRPGDLLFWSGTYPVEHNPSVSHVMIYIGKNKEGQHLMAGASNGRTYKGRKIWGVSVFDFNLPHLNDKSRFLGYSCIPKINCSTF